jgi:hypothetical protein
MLEMLSQECLDIRVSQMKKKIAKMTITRVIMPQKPREKWLNELGQRSSREKSRL